MDYLPAGCLVCVSESGRTAEALKGWLGQLKADVTAAMDSGILCGPMAEAALSETEFARQLERFPVCQLESLPTSRYLLAPKALLQIDARQLSGYGGSLETAVTDLTHYLTGGCRVVVLCGGQVRARNLLMGFCSSIAHFAGCVNRNKPRKSCHCRTSLRTGPE